MDQRLMNKALLQIMKKVLNTLHILMRLKVNNFNIKTLQTLIL